MENNNFIFEQKIVNKEEIIITGNINLLDKFKKFNLNEREIKIIVSVFEGKINKDIATDVDISVKSVENALTKIYEKTEAKDKIDLLLKLLEIKVERG